MGSTPQSDAAYGDYFVDISKGNKRWVRVTVKDYETTGKYFFLKMFRSENGTNFQKQQKFTMTLDEMKAFIGKVQPIIDASAQQASVIKATKEIPLEAVTAPMKSDSVNATEQIILEAVATSTPIKVQAGGPATPPAPKKRRVVRKKQSETLEVRASVEDIPTTVVVDIPAPEADSSTTNNEDIFPQAELYGDVDSGFWENGQRLFQEQSQYPYCTQL